MRGTTETFGTAVRRLRGERGLSIERLAHATWRNGTPGLTVGYVGMLERGERSPSPDAIEALAHALGVDPGEFVEYRLARVREQFDERQVGLERAAENLSEFERARWEALEESSRDAERLRQDPAASPSQSATGAADPRPAPRARRRASARRGRA